MALCLSKIYPKIGFCSSFKNGLFSIIIFLSFCFYGLSQRNVSTLKHEVKYSVHICISVYSNTQFLYNLYAIETSENKDAK